MANKPLPSQEVLRQLLDYNPDTGALTWKRRPRKMFKADGPFRTWNSRFAGKEAFTSVNLSGYRYGTLLYGVCRAHRVIWKWWTGEDPQQVDHINGIRTDNRVANLRSATCHENSRNVRSHKDSTSSFVGVSWDKRRQKWRANIMVAGRARSLGYHAQEEDAARAYDAAAREHHGKFANPNFA